MQSLFIFFETYTNGFRVEILGIFGLASIVCGILVIISKNPIVSVLYLIGLFVSIASYLIMMGISFIGLSYLLVYVGAVSILFLFILMLINVRISELQSETSNSVPLAVIATLCFVYAMHVTLPDSLELLSNHTVSFYDTFNYVWSFIHSNYYLKNFFLFFFRDSSGETALVTSSSWDLNLGETSHITSIGNIMYTSYSIWLIITSLILLLAMVGAILITIEKKESKYFRLSSKPHTFTSLPLQSKISISLDLFPFDAITRGLIDFYNILTVPYCLKTLKNSTIFKACIYIFASLFLLLGFEPFTVSLSITILLIIYYTLSFYVRYKLQFDKWITNLTVLVLTITCLVIFWKLLLLVLGYALDLTTIISLSTVSGFLVNYELCMNPGDPGSNGGGDSSSGGAAGPPGGPSGGGLPHGLNTVEQDELAKKKAKKKIANEKHKANKAREAEYKEASKSVGPSQYKQELNHILNVDENGPKTFEDADLFRAIVKVKLSEDNPDLDFLNRYRAGLSVERSEMLAEKSSLKGEAALDKQADINEYLRRIHEVDRIINKHTDNN